MVENLITTNHY